MDTLNLMSNDEGVAILAVFAVLAFLIMFWRRRKPVASQPLLQSNRRDMDSGEPMEKGEKKIADLSAITYMGDKEEVEVTARITGSKLIVFNQLQNNIYWTFFHGERIGPLAVPLAEISEVRLDYSTSPTTMLVHHRQDGPIYAIMSRDKKRKFEKFVKLLRQATGTS